jgi:hypothetical protein
MYGAQPSKRRPRMVLAAFAAVCVISGVGALALYGRHDSPRRFDIPKSALHPGCSIEEGWTPEHVSAVCGEPRGGGGQPKIGARTAGTNLFLCSAPCELFGETLVLYGCDGKVWETQAKSDRWRCSITMHDEGWERGDP